MGVASSIESDHAILQRMISSGPLALRPQAGTVIRTRRRAVQINDLATWISFLDQGQHSVGACFKPHLSVTGTRTNAAPRVSTFPPV